MKRRFGFKPKLRDQLRSNHAALSFMALGAPEEKREVAETMVARMTAAIPPAPKKRAAPIPTGEPLEKDILRECLAALRAHPAVAFVGRFNRGAVVSGDQHGATRYTSFNSVPGFPDIHGMLEGGRAFYIETKRRGKKPDDRQANFLATITACGGIAGVATSSAEAIALIVPTA